MPVVGTAGHVDHGKSTLIERLTGRDPDRWQEEKDRGLTIDLGFSWMRLPGGTEVSFVDVPGHERFIKNMLAGSEVIDAALFVVAADEGWMPQSEEHLGVLDLLGTEAAVVAVTKSDRVDAETVELAMLEVEEELVGTSLEGSLIVPVSALTGDGIEVLLDALESLVAQPIETDGRPRLWIDRAFSIAGAGTVVTGTLLGDQLAVGDEVELYPAGRRGRVRAIQSHEQEHERVDPWRRVALNLSGVEVDAVGRGTLAAPPGQWLASDSFSALVRPVRRLAEPLTEKGAYHLHMGSGAWPVRLRIIGATEIEPDTVVHIRSNGAIPMSLGDRFILREVGRRAVVAGGRVLDPDPDPRSRAIKSAARRLKEVLDATPDEAADALLEIRGTDELSRLAAHSSGGRPHQDAAGTLAMSQAYRDRMQVGVVELATQFHDANPLREGIPRAELTSQLGISPAIVDALIESDPRLLARGSAVAVAGFSDALSAEQESAWEGARDSLNTLAVPRVGELGLDNELLHALVRQGRIIRVSEELAFLPSVMDRIQESMKLLPERFTVAEFRDQLEISRKYAVPLLEWLDKNGVTLRQGDTRTLR